MFLGTTCRERCASLPPGLRRIGCPLSTAPIFLFCFSLSRLAGGYTVADNQSRTGGGRSPSGNQPGVVHRVVQGFPQISPCLLVWADLWKTVSRRLWAPLWATPDGKECAGSAAHPKKAGAWAPAQEKAPKIHDLRGAKPGPGLNVVKNVFLNTPCVYYFVSNISQYRINKLISFNSVFS